MTDGWDRIPIFCVDVQGFTTYNADTQKVIVQRLQDLATEAARQFVPDGEVWSTWRRHGTGDGYYFLLLAASPQQALHYALALNDILAAHNARHGLALPLRLYGALDLGRVELVNDQYHGEALARVARFLSHQPFKEYAGRQDHPLALAMTALFHTACQADSTEETRLPVLVDTPWEPVAFHDKHGFEHRGFVRGTGWELPTATPAPQPTLGEVKLAFCRRLGDDWSDLADVLGIQPHDKRRFRPGFEPTGVWEWLQRRRRLTDLPGAVRTIGREDLLEDFPDPS